MLETAENGDSRKLNPNNEMATVRGRDFSREARRLRLGRTTSAFDDRS
jgi:hypothetical protein